MEYQVTSLKAMPDLTETLRKLNNRSWPAFIIHGDAYSWKRYYAELGDCILLLTDADGALIGAGFTVPVIWNGELDTLPVTIEQIIISGLAGRRAAANTLIAVAALVDRRYRGEGISAEILKQVKASALERGCQHLIIPVRPTWKARYPLVPMARYAQWRNKDGLLYDPWLRTHERLGATVMKCVDSTLEIQGTVKDWEKWTGMVFPDSGAYVVPHALQPVEIDVAADRGIYHEPNVWMRHPLP